MYAVGDVHGRLDLLDKALALIERHAGRAARQTIFLGDYVDRGPESRGVVERLMALQQDGRTVCLKGNHEDL
ncbi:MAG TPA: metallophosphoesterase, partial [Caulobacteraceae bacterium]|nr:metallophosphoesterase [Caulobacteraceae bacterium]